MFKNLYIAEIKDDTVIRYQKFSNGELMHEEAIDLAKQGYSRFQDNYIIDVDFKTTESSPIHNVLKQILMKEYISKL